jgi:hypothetical protein
MVNFERGIFSTTIGGETYYTKSYNDLKRKIAVFESDKGVRKGKSVLAHWRELK